MKGGKILDNAVIPFSSSLCKPPDADFGLIKLIDGNQIDYIIIGESSISDTDEVQFSIEETRIINEQQMGDRSGAATGFLLPSMNFCNDSKSLSAITKEKTRCFIRKPKSNSTLVRVAYKIILIR